MRGVFQNRTPRNLLFTVIIISLFIRILIAYIHFQDTNYSLQQDGYADYAVAMKKGFIDNERVYMVVETRLFPGYPILIFLLSYILKSEIISGLLISIIASVLSVYLFWYLTKNIGLSFLFAVFPPRWIEQSTKIATEPVVVLLLLFSIFLYKRNLFLLTGIFIGLALNIRLISICLLVTLIILLYKNKQVKKILPLFFGFFLTSGLLVLFNYLNFGSERLFQQFYVYNNYISTSVGLFQVIKDVFRTIDWQQYNILISGLFYLLINIISLFYLFVFRKKSLLNEIMFYWMGISLIFVLFLGPVPMLEEFARFTIPFVPAMLYGLYNLFYNISQRITHWYLSKQASVA